MVGHPVQAVEADLDAGAGRVVVEDRRQAGGVGDGEEVGGQLALLGQRGRRCGQHEGVVPQVAGGEASATLWRVDPALQPATSCARPAVAVWAVRMTAMRSASVSV